MSRTAIITAGAGGLGLEIATGFAAKGYRVAALDLVPPAGERGAGIRFHRCDLGDLDALDELIHGIARDLGGVDVLVNNVGVAGPSSAVGEMTLADWRDTFRVNLDSAFVTCNAVLPLMKARGAGCIVNVSTSSVKTALPFRSAYVASKAALEALTAVIAREGGQNGVRANIVRPGAMDNERLNRVIEAVALREEKPVDEVEADLLRFMSMRSKVTMAEVAGMVFYLASEAARHVTGQVIAVDAGVEWEQ